MATDPPFRGTVPVLEVGGTHVTAGLVVDGRVERTVRRPLDSAACLTWS